MSRKNAYLETSFEKFKAKKLIRKIVKESLKEELENKQKHDVIITYDINKKYYKDIKKELDKVLGLNAINRITESVYRLNKQMTIKEIKKLNNTIRTHFYKIHKNINEDKRKEKKVVITILYGDNNEINEIKSVNEKVD